MIEPPLSLLDLYVGTVYISNIFEQDDQRNGGAPSTPGRNQPLHVPPTAQPRHLRFHPHRRRLHGHQTRPSSTTSDTTATWTSSTVSTGACMNNISSSQTRIRVSSPSSDTFPAITGSAATRLLSARVWSLGARYKSAGRRNKLAPRRRWLISAVSKRSVKRMMAGECSLFLSFPWLS